MGVECMLPRILDRQFLGFRDESPVAGQGGSVNAFISQRRPPAQDSWLLTYMDVDQSSFEQVLERARIQVGSNHYAVMNRVRDRDEGGGVCGD